jgi:hypothetical protein
MKIISTFKDYYDHQAHIYGGGDPRITYVRGTIQSDSILGTDAIPVPTRSHTAITLLCNFSGKWADVLNPRWMVAGDDNHGNVLRLLAIAGRLFLLVGTPVTPEGGMRFSVLSERNPDHAHTLDRLSNRPPFFWEKRFQVADLVGSEEPALIPLSRALGVPVFVVSDIAYIARDDKHRLAITVETTIPILGDLGLPAIYTPQQIYQDIAYFMGNTLHESPDIAPPVSVSDRDRLVQHGFDAKASFRHRK